MSFVKRYSLIFTHIFVWFIILMFPIAITTGNGMSVVHAAPLYIHPLFIFIIFYLNYFVLIKYLYFNRKNRYTFYALNIVLSVVFAFAIQLSINALIRRSDDMPHPKMEQLMPPPSDHEVDAKMPPPHKPYGRGIVVFGVHLEWDNLLQSLIYMLSTVILAVFLKTLAKNSDMERIQKESELKNLQQQLSPHFLFNTLNNIYSLIAINQDKAQKAVYDLSKMLRYVLYQDRGELVVFADEIKFMESYIQLAKLRYDSHVEVKHECLLDDVDRGKEVIPLIAVCLIENAFKHGVHPTKHSLINIRMERADDHFIHLEIVNTYFPKNKEDKSGSGIGLVNLRRRLDIAFGSNYTFTAEKQGDYYVASLYAPLDR